MRRLYYRDSYGYVRRDRQAGQRTSMALAAIVVLTSPSHLPARPSRSSRSPAPLTRKRQRPAPARPGAQPRTAPMPAGLWICLSRRCCPPRPRRKEPAPLPGGVHTSP